MTILEIMTLNNIKFGLTMVPCQLITLEIKFKIAEF